MNRGELWWLEEPGGGRRPVCILTRAEAIPVLRRVTVAPATRTIRDIPTEVDLGPEDGLPQRCVLTLDNVTTVPKALLVDHIATLPQRRLRELCVALEIALGC
ncbi:MAG TPA: type II toxin-antitoxin system PemK/MazF family toxin [Solirubrobacteraceae bacterium]|nr:type II toxin-antitoxin system PemK/MazF family toxin [Solirubrobacteraceae bacterium]